MFPYGGFNSYTRTVCYQEEAFEDTLYKITKETPLAANLSQSRCACIPSFFSASLTDSLRLSQTVTEWAPPPHSLYMVSMRFKSGMHLCRALMLLLWSFASLDIFFCARGHGPVQMPYQSKVCGSLMSVSSRAISLTLSHSGASITRLHSKIYAQPRLLFVSCSLKCLVTPYCFTPISRVAFFFKHKAFC